MFTPQLLSINETAGTRTSSACGTPGYHIVGRWCGSWCVAYRCVAGGKTRAKAFGRGKAIEVEKIQVVGVEEREDRSRGKRLFRL